MSLSRNDSISKEEKLEEKQEKKSGNVLVGNTNSAKILDEMRSIVLKKV